MLGLAAWCCTPSPAARTFPPMSCTPLSPIHHQVLNLLAYAQPIPEHLAAVLAELEGWGWVLPRR